MSKQLQKITMRRKLMGGKEKLRTVSFYSLSQVSHRGSERLKRQKHKHNCWIVLVWTAFKVVHIQRADRCSCII